MKIAMELTLDGMLKALKWTAHRMAEEIEADYPAAARRVNMTARMPDGRLAGERGDGDDRRGL